MRILVIEDNEKHLKDARTHSAKLTGCVVDFATNLSEAMGLLSKNAYDGVISDVFFPAESGASAETHQNALLVSAKLAEMGVHFVFNTAGNHHGAKLYDFNQEVDGPRAILVPKRHDYWLGFLMSGMLIESYPKESEAEADMKQWEAAFRYILLSLALVKLPDKGRGIMEEAELESILGGDGGQLTGLFRRCSHPFVSSTFEAFNA